MKFKVSRSGTDPETRGGTVAKTDSADRALLALAKSAMKSADPVSLFLWAEADGVAPHIVAELTVYRPDEVKSK